MALTNNQRGIAAICGCMASYTVNDVLVKEIEAQKITSVALPRLATGVGGLKWDDVKHAVDRASGHAIVIIPPKAKTGDAQIFIDLLDLPRLDHDYTVFARVIGGMDVADQILEGDVIGRVIVR